MLENRYYLYRPWIPVCKSIEAKIVNDLELTPPILDIGCGNGLFATHSFSQKIDTGLDYDTNAVKAAERTGIYKEVILADARSLPFKDESFNTVISICALEHISQADKVFSGIYRVLKKGGRLIFTVPSENFGSYLFGSRVLSLLGLKGLAKRYGDKKNDKSGHLLVYPPSQWKKSLEETGFRAGSIDYIFPKDAVLLWSFFHSIIFNILFLPFRLLRDLNIKAVDNLLRTILRNSLSRWISARSGKYSSKGGYLLIEVYK